MRNDHEAAAFVYGTLRFPEVLVALLARRPEFEPATVADHRVVGLPRVNYPGLVEVRGEEASGFVVRGLSPHEWSIIDLYEDEFYELATVEAATEAGEAVQCSVYRLPPSMSWDGDWSPEAFEADELATFAAWVSVWRATEPTSPLT